MSLNESLNGGVQAKFSKIDEYTIRLSSSLSLRIYSDTKPFNGDIADLQKGLILVYKGVEAVGEGTGFGAPVIIYPNETFFSGSSQVFLSRENDSVIIRKEFFMDKVQRSMFRNVSLKNRKLLAVLRYLAGLYQEHRRTRTPMLKSQSLMRRMGFHNRFVNVTPNAKVIVTYCLSQGHILVKADFRQIKGKNPQIFMLNEQGTLFFKRYLDSNGKKLLDEQIGAWEPIDSEWASVTNPQGRVGFRLKRLKNSFLRIGREYLEDSLDWVGLDYELHPNEYYFEYGIEILEDNS
ncbi:MAG: hypothetical protein WED07_16070 [Candidatus Freyarchaeum deiterrae]